jgi:hypothetical protein
MKLIVAGSRTFQDYTLLSSVLGTHRHHITELLHGGARGADRLAFRWAVRHHVRSRCFGKSADIRRHSQLAQAGDLLLAFWDGRSPDTRHLIGCMQQLGKPVVVIRTDTTA